MADDVKNKTISASDTGFPGYLNFDTLRSSSIEYLGKLSGKVWTDHNVHDPGITILEVLIYALLDLGYRTNLPVQDLFSRNPAEKGKDNNFFSAAQILANNPLTILDYRKLLVDIEGVKNAWLEIDTTSPVIFCPPQNNTAAGVALMINEQQKDPCKCDVLNGLYHVYIQLEDAAEKNNNKKNAVVSKVRSALMAHRNLCEDFVDIHVLCSLDIGLCVDIELLQDADAEEVYFKMVEALQEYFSPSPVFYSLQQLLDKGKTIDEIFAGRPFNITESHGFTDAEEFDQLKLKKELHLSDVYHILSDIEGISSVRNLGWIKCCDKKTAVQEWKLVLPENYIPKFSTSCSGFTFSRNGLPVNIDVKSFESLLQLKSTGNQKALYKQDSPYLNPEVPTGVYRNDLADYYSIQNDLPSTYGIREGGLDINATDQRKAQALQLQGYLLFFDQLLANYLTQLKNIRSLFALSSPANVNDAHTYFTNQLTDVPQLQQLLRYNNNASVSSSLGTEGGILAYPTSKLRINELITNGKLKAGCASKRCNDRNDDEFPGYKFCFAAERDQAINQLKDDLLNGQCQIFTASDDNDHFLFYIFTSSADMALISKVYYTTETAALNAAASLQYISSFAENYRTFIADCCENKATYFSFDIDLNLDSYANFLEQIVESKQLYTSRRQDFLDHLLARFAERFTDYALLSASFLTPAELKTKQIAAEEHFLSQYDDISSNRGKGYDYLKNKWGNENISGFEKRFKALAGIENWKRHSLCNFVVEKADAVYKLSVIFFNQAFTVKEKVAGYAEALASLHSVYKKLSAPEFQEQFVTHEDKWEVYITDDAGNKYANEQLFAKKEAAAAFSNTLAAVFNFKPDIKQTVFISAYIHKILFTDHEDKLLAESIAHFAEKDKAITYATSIKNKLAANINNTKEFVWVNKNIKLDKLLPVSTESFPMVFIDEKQFVSTYRTKPYLKLEKIIFSACNKITTIQFNSLKEYDNKKLATEDYQKLLVLMAGKDNYVVEKNKQTDKWGIMIRDGAEKMASYFEEYEQETDAANKINEILAEVIACTYKISPTDAIPDEWEFNYRSQDLSGNTIDYVSTGNYTSEPAAIKSADDFYSNIPDVETAWVKNKLLLQLDKNKVSIKMTANVDQAGEQDAAKAKQLLDFRKELFNKVNHPSEKDFKQLLENNRLNPGEDYIYKLVDKDNLVAYYPANIATDPLTLRDALVSRAAAGYNYIDIDFENCIHERKDKKSKRIWFHYQLTCTNRWYTKGKLAGQHLALFESTQGYTSKEEAITALNDNYLLILKYARREKNYGEGKVISLVEILSHSDDPCCKSSAIVFIPAPTADEFNGYALKYVLPLASSYPVYFIRKNKYRFVIGNVDAATPAFNPDWMSKKFYRTALEAMQQLRFCLMLLKYAGNFYIEDSKDDCKVHIYIREVLALSAHGFDTPEKAWKEGVEKFICVSQTEEGFHNYFNRQNCSNSFFTACGNTGLVHPCVYETTKRRDDIITKLYKAASFNFFDLVSVESEQIVVLKDMDKNPLAKIFTDGKNGPATVCETLMAFAEAVYDDSNYIKKEGTFFLNCRFKNDKQVSYFKIAAPYTGISFKEWKLQLKKIACYFPVISRNDSCAPVGTNSQQKYFVEIKLPGFDCCNDDLVDDPCDCTPVNTDPCQDGCKVSCHVAWKSDCCFDTCCEALDYYIFSFILLQQHENYKPLYDCGCGSYRIGLYPQLALNEEKKLKEKGFNLIKQMNVICRDKAVDTQVAKKDPSFCLNEIVAFNPQSYNNEQVACDAAERAKKLINAEGLHLVEHILLRPRCKDKKGTFVDCGCDALPQPCFKDDICHFQWKSGDDSDPCSNEKEICFTPGCDPYSFIATVALPAWPERFRSKENRQIIEKLLQHEAPAHVLLRVLWLTPRDFCCFEYYFKQWSQWMAGKLCHEYNYSNCDFLRIMFKKYFDELPECKECNNCSCGEEQSSCFSKTKDPCAEVTVLQKINELYCWSAEKGYDFTSCEARDEKFDVTIIEKVPAVPVAIPVPLVKETTIATPVTAPVAIAQKTDPVSVSKGDMFRLRAKTYKENIEAAIKDNKGNEVADRVLTFLRKPPVPQNFAEFVQAVLKDKTEKGKNIKGLTTAQKKIVIENITWNYLDQVCFDKNADAEKITALHNTFQLIKKNKIDTSALYKGWKSNEFSAFDTAIDLNKIKKTIGGS